MIRHSKIKVTRQHIVRYNKIIIIVQNKFKKKNRIIWLRRLCQSRTKYCI